MQKKFLLHYQEQVLESVVVFISFIQIEAQKTHLVRSWILGLVEFLVFDERSLLFVFWLFVLVAVRGVLEKKKFETNLFSIFNMCQQLLFMAKCHSILKPQTTTFWRAQFWDLGRLTSGSSVTSSITIRWFELLLFELAPSLYGFFTVDSIIWKLRQCVHIVCQSNANESAIIWMNDKIG